jgi:cell wall-associated NlpC family hydrolase
MGGKAVSLARAVARITLPIAVIAGVLLTNVAPAAADSSPKTEFSILYSLGKTKLGDPWVHYAKGPNKFDCVGYVWYLYHENDMQDRIGGYRGVKAYYNWFKSRGKVSKTNPKPGDLVIWGNFQHIGMYVGDGKAISALVNPWGVKVHPVKGWLNEKFRYYLHTNITR